MDFAAVSDMRWYKLSVICCRLAEAVHIVRYLCTLFLLHSIRVSCVSNGVFESYRFRYIGWGERPCDYFILEVLGMRLREDVKSVGISLGNVNNMSDQ